MPVTFFFPDFALNPPLLGALLHVDFSCTCRRKVTFVDVREMSSIVRNDAWNQGIGNVKQIIEVATMMQDPILRM